MKVVHTGPTPGNKGCSTHTLPTWRLLHYIQPIPRNEGCSIHTWPTPGIKGCSTHTLPTWRLLHYIQPIPRNEGCSIHTWPTPGIKGCSTNTLPTWRLLHTHFPRTGSGGCTWPLSQYQALEFLTFQQILVQFSYMSLTCDLQKTSWKRQY